MLCESAYTVKTCDLASATQVNTAADNILSSAFRYVCKSSTNLSPFSTASTPFAASASKNGSHHRPREHHPRTQIRSPARHVEH